MRAISSTLLAAQKAGSHIPYVKLTATDKMTDVVRLKWERLYKGTEEDYYHSLTIPGDGSLIRIRVSTGADNSKLYRQRVANPGPASDFSSWTYTGQYSCQAVAAVCLGSEVSIFLVNFAGQLKHIKSMDDGVNWGSSELIDYASTTFVYGMAGAYKPNRDVAVFLTGDNSLYVKKCVGGEWQEMSPWDKTTGALTSVAAVYDGDWNLLVTGQDTAGNYKVWSLVYGDGLNVAAGTWSGIKEFASAPAGGHYTYGGVFLDKTDVYRAFYIEKYDGVQPHTRPYWTNNAADAGFLNNLWREPVPFNLTCEYGPAMSHYAGYAWLSCPFGVWRAALAVQSLELTGDILNARCEIQPSEGKLTVELRNDDGRYNGAGSGSLEVLDNGCQLDFNPGYVTPAGNEISPGLSFWLDTYEYLSGDGKASLILQGRDGWGLLADWRAHHQFRWNQDAEEMSVKEMLEFILARVGLKLVVKSQSGAAIGFYPDFTIHPGDGGTAIIKRLLSMIPDVIFIEGAKAFLVDPLSSDSAVYPYGNAHTILRARYLTGAGINRVRVEGLDPVTGEPVICDSFSWEGMNRFYEKAIEIPDRNISTVAEAESRGEACLRKADIASRSGIMQAPVNCAQQLYDVIEINDVSAGLSEAKRRIAGISLNYRPEKGEYFQQLLLGGV